MRRMTLYAKEDPRRDKNRGGEGVDIPFLVLVLVLLALGLTMLYSASFAQSQYDLSRSTIRAALST